MSERINDGGPAFPTNWEMSPDADGVMQVGMGVFHYPGMTLRDWFAGQAMVAWCTARIHQEVDDLDRNQMAIECYHDADAMLSARNR